MPLMPIKLPEGMYRNGTPYTRKGRWTDGNLVRWHDGSVRPIGGWLRRQASGSDIATLVSDPTLEAIRDAFSWRDNSGAQNTVFGSNLALYHMSQPGVITDITYGTFAALNPNKDPTAVSGFGEGEYGQGAYGAGNNLSGVEPSPPDRWYFSTFGEILLTGVRGNAGIYELDLGTLTPSLVTNAPSAVQDLVVTDQRQVLTIGGGGEPRRLQTSEVEDRTVWTPATNNQAVDRVIAGTGKLQRCVNVLQQVLLLGENDAHVARYIGPPYVYSVDLAGENCGSLAPEALARTDRFAVWWGKRNFWIFDGSVQPLECSVIDFLYSDLDPNQVSKISTYTNTDFSEVWWLYQSLTTTTTECDSYVVWNYKKNTWNTGRIDRTAGIDRGVLLTPVKVASSGEIYNHELSDVLPMGDIFVESGSIELGNGDKNMAVRYIYPDTEGTGGVTFNLIARQLPNDTEYTYGPYTDQNSNPIPTRALGRAIKLRADLDNVSSELGDVRLDFAPSGTGSR